MVIIWRLRNFCTQVAVLKWSAPYPTEIPNFHTLIARSRSSISAEHGSSGSKTLLHLFQSHSDPGGKQSMMACKMGGRVSNFQLYLRLGTQLSYVVFLAYPDFLCREGVRKGFCGFWVAWRWWRAYWIFMQLIKLYGIIPPYIQRKYPIFTPLTDLLSNYTTLHHLSKGNI
jgi:hypothetical protein